MHPVEQLRYVARVSGADAGLLVEESAHALSAFANDKAALLVACRRLLARQPALGPLWWLTTRLVLAQEARRAAVEAAQELGADRTPRELAAALSDGARVAVAGWPHQTVSGLRRRGDLSVLVADVEGSGSSTARYLESDGLAAEAVEGGRIAGIVEEVDLVVLEASAVGLSAGIVDVGSTGLAAMAKAAGRPVWLMVGVGRRVPEPYWQEIVARCFDDELPAWLRPYEALPLGLVDRLITSDGAQAPTFDCDDGLAVAPELLGPTGS